MSTLRQALSDTLLKQALKAETAERRALAVQAIGRVVRDRSLTDEDRDFATKLFDVISRDVCEEVRRALAVTLRLSPNLPRKIANRLLFDIDSIALPILSHSPVVTDEDLISVLRSRTAAKIKAIAERNGVSPRVSQAVISSGDVQAIAALAANDTALISETDAKRLVQLGESVDLIREATLKRQDLPASLTLRLIDRQVDAVDLTLADRQELTDNPVLRRRIVSDTRARAQTGYVGQDWPANALKDYVETLAERGHLSDAVIARAAGQGDWRFVQLALARRAGISAVKAGLIAFDPLPFPITTLCTRADIGPAAEALIQASRSAFLDIERSKRPMTRRAFQRLMAERVASHPNAKLYEARWMDWLDDGLELRLASTT